MRSSESLKSICGSSRWCGSMMKCVALIAAVLAGSMPGAVCGKEVVEWYFSKAAHGWVGGGTTGQVLGTPEGLLVRSKGEDPWIEGPGVDLRGSKIIRVKIRMKSSLDEGAQLFYGRGFTEQDSARFAVQNDGKWHDYSVVIRKVLGPGTRFRLDPCYSEGEVTIGAISVETISEIAAPVLRKPTRPSRGRNETSVVKAGRLEFEHYGGGWGQFVLKVDGVEMAAGYTDEQIGLVIGDDAQWLSLKDAKVSAGSRAGDGMFTIEAVVRDSKAGTWKIRRNVRAAEREATLAVETEVTVDEDRDVIYLPWLTVFPGLGTFGEKKEQGLFAGLEYLCDEPSSSKADIETEEHIRRVPEPAKITFPLMAISQGGRYVGLIWEPGPAVAAMFDSPDRIYNCGAHVMALSAPAVGDMRFENGLCAHTPFRLRGGQAVKASMLIIGGKGGSIAAAIRDYVDLKGLPAVPEFEGRFDAAVDLLGRGWLDSEINVESRFRHAVWGESFGPVAAADAAMFIDWLANQTKDGALRSRLTELKSSALSRISPDNPFTSEISHAHLPSAPFVFGRVRQFVEHKHSQASGLLGGFDDDGVKLYRAGGTDYGRTHFARHANGLAGREMVAILEGATLSADKELIEKALELLDKETALYADTVPRGAQTWEVPLHTPDILASAHLVKAYTLGYVVSGRREYLEQAKYWAWTGVPFVYLKAPTDGRVGAYATIAVLGATNWRAPVWFARPVQWCGLVYASALQLLGEYDRQGPWEQIARGITAAGLQMSWPTTDEKRQGLLPDFFDLKAQVGAGPAINPGTVQAHLPELYGRGKLYDVKRLTNRGGFVHAPCAITDIREGPDVITFVTAGWGEGPYYVLVAGVEKRPGEILGCEARQVSKEGEEGFKPCAAEVDDDAGRLVLKLRGRCEVRIASQNGRKMDQRK